MKNIQVLVLAFACSMSGVFVAETAADSGPAPAPEFSTMQWLKDNKRPLGFVTGLGVAGVGGLVGTGFVIKKIVRVAKEAIALKKQLQVNPKDMSLRKKRRALIRKAIGLGIGGLVLGFLSGCAVGCSWLLLNHTRDGYGRSKRRHASMLRVAQIQRDYVQVREPAWVWPTFMSSLNKRILNPVNGYSIFTPQQRRAPQEGDSIRFSDPEAERLIVYRNDTWDFSNAPVNLIIATINEQNWTNMGFTSESHQAFLDAQQASHEQLLKERGAASGSDYTNSSFAIGPGDALEEDFV